MRTSSAPEVRSLYRATMAYEESRWRYAAATLGLMLLERGYWGREGCFEKLVRERGRPVDQSPAKTELWMNGRVPVPAVQRDVEVFVLARSVDTSSGTGEHVTHSTSHYTHVIARIDPPLLMGLELDLQRPVEVFGRMPSIATGDPYFDNELYLNAAMAGPAARLFTRIQAPPGDLVDHLFAIKRYGTSIHVSDTCVDVQMSFTDDVQRLGPTIAAATALAAYLGARRGPLPRDAEEHARLGPWKACADAERLDFDEARFAVAGTIAGVRARIAVETEKRELFTSLEVQPPRSLGLGLRLSKQGAMQFLAGIFGSQDVRVGDEAFDKAFVIKGTNEAGIKALFGASPAARLALLELLAWSPDLVLTDDGLTARWPRVADGATLHRAIQIVKAVATALAPAQGYGQAYR